MGIQAILSEPRIWWQAVLPGLLCLGLAAAAGAALRRRAGRVQWPPARPLGQTGSAVIFDFVIAIEFVFIFTGLVIQYGLMTHALAVVQQSAYWAGRSASVYIPAYYPEAKLGSTPSHPALVRVLASSLRVLNPIEPSLPAAGSASNPEQPGEYGPLKKERVRMAAALACMPAATSLFKALPDFAQTIGSAISAIPTGPLAGAQNFLERLAYAYKFTEVFVFYRDKDLAIAANFDDAWTIETVVRFRYYLHVPFARRLLTFRLTGPWGWHSDLLSKAQVLAGSLTPPASDYVKFYDSGKQAVPLEANWIFFRENSYWGTPAAPKNPDYQASDEYKNYFQQYGGNQQKPNYEQADGADEQEHADDANFDAEAEKKKQCDKIQASLAARRESWRQNWLNSWRAAHALDDPMPPEPTPPDPPKGDSGYWVQPSSECYDPSVNH